jgi:hypothetical protein
MTTNICPDCGGWTCCGNHKHGAQCRCEPMTDPLPFTATGPDVFAQTLTEFLDWVFSRDHDADADADRLCPDQTCPCHPGTYVVVR